MKRVASLLIGAWLALPGAADSAPLRIVAPEAAFDSVHTATAMPTQPGNAPATGIVQTADSLAALRRLADESAPALGAITADLPQGLAVGAYPREPHLAASASRLRVIAPLQREQMYFIVRADATLQYIDEIAGARINVGPANSDAARTVETLYALMFGSRPDTSHESFLDDEDALVRLVSDMSIDVVVVLATPPAKLLTSMKPESRRYIKFLKLARDHPSTRRLLGTYVATPMRASNYRNLLVDDVPTLGVESYLVTAAPDTGPVAQTLVGLARTWCATSGGPLDAVAGMREGSALPKLARGWSWYPPTAEELEVCASAHAAARSTY